MCFPDLKMSEEKSEEVGSDDSLLTSADFSESSSL